MLTLFDQSSNTIQFTESFNVVNRNISPFKDFINKTDFTSYSVSINEEKISFKDTFLYQVNIKGSGSLYVIYRKEGFNKDEITSKLMELKDIEVYNVESSKDKTNKAINILEEYHPLFYLYVQKEGFVLSLDELKEIYQGNSPIFLIEKEKEVVKEKKEIKARSGNKKFSIKEFFSPIKENKNHFIFLTIASFLIGFAFSLGLFNSMLGKGISILFYVCSFAGLVLHTFIYYDYFSTNKIKDPLFKYSVAFSTIGIVLALIGLLLYNAIDKTDGKENLPLWLIILSVLLVAFGSATISILLSYFIKKKKR